LNKKITTKQEDLNEMVYEKCETFFTNFNKPRNEQTNLPKRDAHASNFDFFGWIIKKTTRLDTFKACCERKFTTANHVIYKNNKSDSCINKTV